MQAEAEHKAFECNICIEQAKNPVVTLCGHLYCWPCLYQWLELRKDCQSCPVCKARIDKNKVIPIYGRGSEESDPRKKPVAIPTYREEAIPRRPVGQRANLPERPANASNFGMHLGFGATHFPLTYNYLHGGGREPLTPSQQHQAFWTKLFLAVGSFIFMYHLLF